MVAAMKFQLPSFVNVNEEKESEEPIEIEIDAGIELPSYLLIPESEDCLAESEECSDDEELFTLSIAEIPTCSQSWIAVLRMDLYQLFNWNAYVNL